MASGEIHPTDLAAEQPTSETNAFTATDKSYLPTKGEDIDVAVEPQPTVNKDDAADKKRKAVDATPTSQPTKRPKVTVEHTNTQVDPPPGQPGQCTRPSELSGTHSQASIPASSQPAPARDKIEEWCDDATAVEQGFIRTGRKPYQPPLPNLYTEPELDDDLLDGHDWLYQEHGKAIRHTTKPLPPRDNIIQFTDKPEYAQELAKNLLLDQCPQDTHAAVRNLCIEFWDCFTQDGLSLPIRGFEFVVDTGAVSYTHLRAHET